MKLIATLFFTLTLGLNLSGQYLEDFPVDNRGILNPGCSGITLGTCSNTDFTGVTWTMGGDLSGIGTEGFSTTGGVLLGINTDTRACWVSPTIYINGASGGTASLTVSLSIPATSTDWDDVIGSDYMDVEYSIDGGGYVQIPNVHGAPNSHTVSAEGSGAGLPSGSNFTAMATGLVGTTLNVIVCIDANLSSESGQINSVSVPQSGVSLPIDLSSFTAKDKKEGVQLQWTTITEINNDYFQLERSTDGINFTPIAKIAGAHFSFQTIEYEHLDTDFPNAPQLFYRLHQFDFNGNSALSHVEVVDNKMSEKALRISPNPVDGFSTILQVQSELQGNLQVSVMDVQGIKHLNQTVDSDSGNWELDTTALPAGTYVLTIASATQTMSKRFIKVD